MVSSDLVHVKSQTWPHLKSFGDVEAGDCMHRAQWNTLRLAEGMGHVPHLNQSEQTLGGTSAPRPRPLAFVSDLREKG